MEKKFLGYKVTFYACASTFATLSLFSLYNCMMPEIIARMNTTAAQLGVASTIQTIIGFVLSFFAGPVYKKVHAETWLRLTPFVMIIFVLFCLYSPSVYFMYLAMAMFGVFFTFSCVTGANVVISGWFIKKRDEMMSYTQTSSMLGMTLASFGFSILTRFFDVKTTVFIFLIFYSAVNFFFSFQIRTPQQAGQKPLGYEEGGEGTAEEVIYTGLELKEAVKTPSMVLLSLSIFIGGLALIVGSYSTVVMTAFGFSVADAALVYTFYSLATALGAMFMGKIASKVNEKMYVLIAYTFLTIALALLFLWMNGNGHNYILSIVVFVALGVGASGMNIFAPIMVPRLFGMKAFSSILPIIVGFFSFGVGTASFITPALAGTYGWATAVLITIGFVIISLVGSLLAAILSPMKRLKA